MLVRRNLVQESIPPKSDEKDEGASHGTRNTIAMEDLTDMAIETHFPTAIGKNARKS